jgi:hypothetical protein
VAEQPHTLARQRTGCEPAVHSMKICEIAVLGIDAG